MANVPNELKYTKDHEWAKPEGKTATFGITAFAGEQLGDIVFVDLPKKGAVLKAGATFGAVESTKATSDLFAPVSGTVVEVNGAVADAPETLNSDPYGKGWLVKVEMADPKELDKLMAPEQYQTHIQNSSH